MNVDDIHESTLRPGGPLGAAFWSEVDVRSIRECWAWAGRRSVAEYGLFEFAGRSFHAHRLAFRFGYGRKICGLLVLHSCDNRWCVNPRHLRLGTRSDNTLDANIAKKIAKHQACVGKAVGA